MKGRAGQLVTASYLVAILANCRGSFTVKRMALAPERFVEWMSGHTANDNKHGRKVYRYHPRSDHHSNQLCLMVWEDLLGASAVLAAHAAAGIVIGKTNARFTFPSGKTKNLDLAIGEPASEGTSLHLQSLRISLEAKQCMTEHQKSQPRIYDELSSSHEIVHQGHPRAIAAGIVVVNIADRFASPLRQKARGPVTFTAHRQPAVTASMIMHLQGLKMRSGDETVGFDAFATVVVSCDNVGACSLIREPPAPQVGDDHHYEGFLRRISEAYERRFGE